MNTQQLEWSDTIPMCEKNKKKIPPRPGIYIVTIVDDELVPLPILRENRRWDYNGVMYIGGTTRNGSLQGRFSDHLGPHTDGMNGKIEKDGNEQDLVALWRDIRSVYPNAGLAFQYCELDSPSTAGLTEKLLQAAYILEFGENPESGKRSLLHNPQHPWRDDLSKRSSKNVR